jgi:putative ABC transport system permease protein
MIQNYLKIAMRSLLKQPGYTAINILGLTIGLTACLLIALWVADEWGFDRFHEKSARIYRAQADVVFGGANSHMAVSAAPMAKTLEKDYPQIEAACRLRDRGAFSVRREDEVFSEGRVLFADTSLFRVFTFPLLEGDPHTALHEPNTVVVSEKIAQKYFFGRSPIGETLNFDNKRQAKITGVMRDIPENSHIQADFFISMLGLEEAKNEEWLSFNFNTYLLFHEKSDPEAFRAEWPVFVRRYIGQEAERILGQKWDDMLKNGSSVAFDMIPLADIHLKGGNRTGDLSPNGSMATVRIFGIVAFFILLLAAVNFMNLSTARSAQRAREVGVRKVMGSGRSQLVGQFLTESVLVSLFAGLLALPLVRGFLPLFNRFSGKAIEFDFWSEPRLLAGVLVFILATGILAGIYPALVLSGFQPIKAMRSNNLYAGEGGGKWLRNALVTFQFATSLVLIVGALVTWKQMNFIQHKNLGFDRSQVLVVEDALTLGEKAKVFKSEVLRLPGVESGTISGYLPTNGNHSDQILFKSMPFTPENGIATNTWWVDDDYLKTMKIKLLEGRNFDSDAPADSNSVVINRKAAKIFGFEAPLDKEIFQLTDVATNAFKTLRVVGVIEDFHFESLRDEIEPLVLNRGNYPASISFRLKTNDLKSGIADIKNIWEKAAPGLPFNYEFMDEQFDQIYRSESRAGSLILGFAVLAVVIACLGLFGLATFITQQRTKEIGIRKVLGASIASITGLLAKDFLKLVLIAIVIASPIAYYFMQKWLSDFVYRIDIEWWMFVAAGLMAVGTAFLTVGFQSVRAALANPVKSLRSE